MSATKGSSRLSGREKAGTKVGSWLGGILYISKRCSESYVKREEFFEMFPMGRNTIFSLVKKQKPYKYICEITTHCHLGLDLTKRLINGDTKGL